MTVVINGTTGIDTVQDAKVSPAKLTVNGSGGFTLPTTAGNAVVADSSGRVTMPYQPRFWAGTTSGGTVNSSTVLPFDYTDINVGGHYNTSTKRFTAPIAGTYYFIAQPALFNPSNSRISLRKNGTVVMYHEQAPASGWQTCTFGVLLTLAVNDYVDVFNSTGVSVSLDWAGNYSNFSGWLVG